MPDDFIDRLPGEVRGWVQDGLITDAQAKRILERYETGGISGGVDWTSTLLYGTATVLVSAAAIAFVMVGLDPVSEEPFLLGLGAALVASGFAVHVGMPDRDLLADVLLGAGMGPLAVATFTEPETVAGLYAVAALAVPSAYLVWRRAQPFLPTLSVIGLTAAAAGTSWSILEAALRDEAVASIWVGLQAMILVGVFLVDRTLREEDATVPASLAVLGFAGAAIPFLFETVGLTDSEMVEIALGAIVVAVLAAGLLARHRGLVMGASIALGLDAIVFAFDVGGVFFGSAVLLGLAIALIVQAEAVKRWVTETT